MIFNVEIPNTLIADFLRLTILMGMVLLVTWFCNEMKLYFRKKRGCE